MKNSNRIMKTKNLTLIIVLTLGGFLWSNIIYAQKSTNPKPESSQLKFYSPEDLAIYVFNCLKTANLNGYIKLFIPITQKRGEFKKIAELQPNKEKFIAWVNSEDHATKDNFEKEFNNKLKSLSEAGIKLDQVNISVIEVKYFDYGIHDKATRIRIEINFNFNNIPNKISLGKDIYRLSDGSWCISNPNL